MYKDIGKFVGPVDQEGIPHGIGKFEFADGSFYIGQFVRGKLDGEGRFENRVDGVVYEGEWRKWKRCGRGREERKKSGEFYEGSWENDKKNGYGTYTCKEG